VHSPFPKWKLSFKVYFMQKITDSKKIEFRKAIQHVSFRDLELFEHAALHDSLAAAARELAVKAPFLTKMIKRLESQLGVELFKRSVDGIRLTSEGLELIGFCNSIKQTLDKTTWRENPQAVEQPHFITLAGSVFLLAHLVAPLLPSITQKEKRGLRLLEMMNSQIVSKEAQSYIDAALHHEKLSWGTSWKSYPLGTLEWVLCARKGHPLPKRSAQAEVIKYPLITSTVLSPKGLRLANDQCPIPSGRRLRLSEVSNGEIGLRIAEVTDQLIFMPSLQAAPAFRAGTLCRIEVTDWQPIRHTLYLSVHQDRVSQRWLQAAISALESGIERAKDIGNVGQ
jgi:DNA-binding transcriptional LysR family regulator